MHLNALAAAIRHLKKHSRFALFNIFGLTIAFIAFFFISVFVSHELRYDDYNVHLDQIFRIESRLRIGNEVTDYAIAPPVVGATIRNKFPAVAAACRIFPERNVRFTLRDELITENQVAYADPSIFDVFTLPLLHGNEAGLLTTPDAIVISRRTALKYFGKTNIVGETMTMVANDSLHSFKVGAVMRDIPRQSHFHFDMLLPMTNLPIHLNTNFLSFYPTSTYVLVAPQSNLQTLTASVNTWVRASIPGYDEIKDGGNEISMILTPLKNIHLDSDKKYELSKNGNRQYIYIFSIGAIFILVMAGINFMNLSLAGFSKRSKETAVKKILGSSAGNLSLQFILESLLLCFASIVLAIVAGWILMDVFNSITEQSITITDLLHSWVIPLMLVTSIVLGLLSGFYPAMLLSSLRPTAIMSGRNFVFGHQSSFSLRHVLLVVQFTVSTFLMISTVIIYRQLSYIHQKETGYDKEKLLVIRNAAAFENPGILKEKILSLPGAVSATLSNFLPTNDTRWSNFGGTATSTSPVQTEFWPVDEDYIPTLGIQMIKGRNFRKSRVTDSSAIILNEAAYQLFGNDDSIFNNDISFSYHQQPTPFHVIGVVKNFHFNSFRQFIGPLVLVLADNRKSSLVVKYRSSDRNDFPVQVENAWRSLQPKEKMNMSYMDDDFNFLYKDDDLMGKVFTIFASLSILIASLGLFSFISNSISARKKEITIRAILGATKRSTAILISRNYLFIVVTSICIAIPIARLVMSRWLEGFAYRYQIHYTDYLFAGMLSLIIAILTLSTGAFAFSTKRLMENIKAT